MSVQACVQTAAQLFSVPSRHIVGECTPREYMRPRLAVYWAAREVLGYSYSQIGRILNRDHTTIMSGYRRALSLRETDATFRAMSDAVGAARMPDACPCCGKDWE